MSRSARSDYLCSKVMATMPSCQERLLPNSSRWWNIKASALIFSCLDNSEWKKSKVILIFWQRPQTNMCRIRLWYNTGTCHLNSSLYWELQAHVLQNSYPQTTHTNTQKDWVCVTEFVRSKLFEWNGCLRKVSIMTTDILWQGGLVFCDISGDVLLSYELWSWSKLMTHSSSS